MKKSCFLIIWFFSFSALSWSFKGHALVAEIAYDNMRPLVQQQVDALAGRVFSQLSLRQQRFLNRRLGGVSAYAKVASMPDRWRKETLQQLFHRFYAPLGTVLRPYANEQTTRWHFANAPYPHRYCHLKNKANVVWAIPLFTRAFLKAHNPNTRAMALVFLSHFVGDAHQPLHMVTGVNWVCQSDAGGNAYCLSGRLGRCELNLHGLWDGGLGYFQKVKNIADTATLLEQEFPKASWASLISQLGPRSWMKSEYQWAPFIYSATEYTLPSRAYYKKGRWIAKQQIVLAGYRLAKMMNDLLS